VITNVYVDGFNLYGGALKGSPYKWLDLDQLAHRLAPRDAVKRIRYFTARVKARPQDPQQPMRQQTYLRALATIPKVTIHEGHFRSDVVRMYSPSLHHTIDVIKTEEKGSDVNLATYVLADAFRHDCEGVMVITNDADLKEPLRLVRDELGVHVTVVNPGEPHKRSLDLPCSAFRQLRHAALAASQFPPTLTDAVGLIEKPSGW